MRCRPGGSPASSKRPSESETANRCTAGTETITPASGWPLNVELAVPRMVAAESSCEAREAGSMPAATSRSEEHTSELQSPCNLVCRLLLEKKKKHPRD